MEDIMKYYNDIPQINLTIPIFIIFILLIFSIIMIVAYIKKNKAYHHNYEYAKKCIDKNKEIVKEYNAILHINQSMSLRREKIVKEIIDDQRLRKYVVEKVMELTGKVELVDT